MRNLRPAKYFLHRFAVRALVIAGLVSCVSGVSKQARASDEATLIEARSKFQRAIELKEASNYAGALKLFREVGAVKMTPQVRYHIATCEENLGQLVAALGGYELAMSSGDQMPTEFIAEVQNSIDELKARIPKLVIQRGEGADAAAIELDGVALGQASIDVEIPLNPGPHTVTASAPGYEDFQDTMTMVEGATETLSIVMQPVPKPAPVEPKERPVVKTEEKRFGLLPWIVGGSGIVVSIAGGTLLGISQVNVGKIRDMCDGTDCTGLSDDDLEKAKKLESSARALEVAGWASLGVGLAAVGTGAVLYYLDKKRGKRSAAFDARRTLVLPAVSHRELGVMFVRSF